MQALSQPLRPDVWRADQLGRAGPAALQLLPSGHAALDAELPGGGWPGAGLVELLQPPEAGPDWQVLLPALAQAGRGPVVLVGAPHGRQPFVPALAAQGLPAARLLWVRAEDDAARLWAGEQALRCADVPAVLAWLPRARVDGLRRLHLAAMDHGKPLFAIRPAAARAESSPAPLRLLVQGGAALQVLVFKRRGPPMLRPVTLSPHAPALAALLVPARQPAVAEVLHGVDRAVAA